MHNAVKMIYLLCPPAHLSRGSWAELVRGGSDHAPGHRGAGAAGAAAAPEGKV